MLHLTEPISMLHGRASGSLDDIMLEEDTDLHKELDDFFGAEAEVSHQQLRYYWAGMRTSQGISMLPCSQLNFPCVPMFPESMFSILVFHEHCLKYHSFCSCVLSFIFFLFPCSQ